MWDILPNRIFKTFTVKLFLYVFLKVRRLSWHGCMFIMQFSGVLYILSSRNLLTPINKIIRLLYSYFLKICSRFLLRSLLTFQQISFLLEQLLCLVSADRSMVGAWPMPGQFYPLFWVFSIWSREFLKLSHMLLPEIPVVPFPFCVLFSQLLF